MLGIIYLFAPLLAGVATFDSTSLLSFENQTPIGVLLLVLVLGFSFCILMESHSDAADVVYACLLVSIIAFFFGIYAVQFYNQLAPGFQLIFDFGSNQFYNITYQFGVDGLSLVFVVLTVFVFPFCFLALRSLPPYKNVKHFCLYLLSMEILLIVTFTTTDLIYFYIFFESLLIPMFILIGIWGSRERKVKAAYYFFLYTLFGSLIMLFSVIYLYFIAGSSNYYVITNIALTAEQQYLIWICFFLHLR